MKKSIKLFLSLLLVSFMMPATVKAEGINNKELYGFSKDITEEPSMPNNNMDNYEELRNQWINTIVDYNEKYYNQSIKSIEENDTSFVLYFDEKGLDISNDINEYNYSYNELAHDEWGVSKIEYVKPEMAYKMSEQIKNPTKEITYDYKFIYYYGWSNGYTKVSQRTFSNFASIIFNATLNYTVDGGLKTFRWLYDNSVGLIINTLNQSQYVKFESYNKFYYENKVCSLRPQGMSTWYPIVQIGRRLAFGWGWTTATLQSTGEPYICKITETMANGIPPTNYDSSAYKPHFNDDTWMINKAMETKNSGGYADVYAICTIER